MQQKLIRVGAQLYQTFPHLHLIDTLKCIFFFIYRQFRHKAQVKLSCILGISFEFLILLFNLTSTVTQKVVMLQIRIEN